VGKAVGEWRVGAEGWVQRGIRGKMVVYMRHTLVYLHHVLWAKMGKENCSLTVYSQMSYRLKWWLAAKQ